MGRLWAYFVHVHAPCMQPSGFHGRLPATGTVTSAVILLEASVRENEEVLSASSAVIKAMSQRAEQLLAALTTGQREQVCPRHLDAGDQEPVSSQ